MHSTYGQYKLLMFIIRGYLYKPPKKRSCFKIHKKVKKEPPILRKTEVYVKPDIDLLKPTPPIIVRSERESVESIFQPWLILIKEFIHYFILASY